jgi:dihydropteroate synthase
MYTLRSRDKSLVLDRPKVMGILNCNRDSFYAPSRSDDQEMISHLIDKLVNDGADIIDIGGMSTKPGSKLIEPGEEISRIDFALTYCKKKYSDVWISVDTVQSEVASFAIKNGADMINDVSGGSMDPKMLQIVGSADLPYVCTHMKGTPENMHLNPFYDDLIIEITEYFIERIDKCLSTGIHQIILDPGFGFGKTIDHNYQLLDRLEKLHSFQKPLLVGLSRKSMIYKYLGIQPEQALNGTSILNTVALMKGASILRVHDVADAVEAVKLVDKLKKS